jgi:dTDP-4-dehydrorhamnose reductase
VTTILVPGKTGQLGRELQTALAPLGTVIALDRASLDLASPKSIRRAVRDTRPKIIVNAAAYTAVDKAESEPELAMQVNGIAPGILAEEAKRLGAILVHYSTDYVFDGALGRPYTEEDVPHPVNEYGLTKLEGERAIQRVGGAFLILRTSWVYSHHGSNFVLGVLRLAREKSELPMVTDQVGSPTWARPLAQATAKLLARGDAPVKHPGVYHMSAPDHVSRHDFAAAIVRIVGGMPGTPGRLAKLRPITSRDYRQPAARPGAAMLSNEKIHRFFGLQLPGWESQLGDFLREYGEGPRTQK